MAQVSRILTQGLALCMAVAMARPDRTFAGTVDTIPDDGIDHRVDVSCARPPTRRSADRGARAWRVENCLDDSPDAAQARADGMINFDFLPSRQIALYLIRMFITRSAAVLVLLVIILMALDLLGESGKILKVHGNGEAELWRYVSLRVPLLIQKFLPFAVLLGALITFTGLSQHSEVIAMKASGLSLFSLI